MSEHAPFLLQCVTEYIAALVVVLSVLYHVNPAVAGVLYGLVHWIANPVSGGYITPVATLFVGPLRHRTWEHIVGLTASQLAAGATAYGVYVIRAGGGTLHGE